MLPLATQGERTKIIIANIMKFSLTDWTVSQVHMLGHREQTQGSLPDVTDQQGYENNRLWSYQFVQW